MSGVQTVTVASEDADIRIDRWFKRHFPTLGHGRLEKLLRTGQVRLDGKRVEAGEHVAAGQQIRIPPLPAAPPPDAKPDRQAPSSADTKFLQERVLYRNEELIVIDKPAELAVQGGTGTKRHLDGLLDALRFDAKERPRLVHRLDKDTSGVLVLARTARAASRLAEAFRGIQTRLCVVSFTSDWLFPTSESRAIVHALNASGARVSFAEIETDRGHDAFLLDVPEFFDISRAFLESAGKARGLTVDGRPT